MRMLMKLTRAGLEVMAPRAHFAGPPKPEGIPTSNLAEPYSIRERTSGCAVDCCAGLLTVALLC